MGIIDSMLQSSCHIFTMVETYNASGCAETVATLVSQPICRIQGMNADRGEMGGKDRSQATHKMWLLPEEIVNLQLGGKLTMNDDTANSYEIVYFEDKISILSSPILDHVEVELKYRQDWDDISVNYGIGVMVIGSTFIVS